MLLANMSHLRKKQIKPRVGRNILDEIGQLELFRDTGHSDEVFGHTGPLFKLLILTR